MDILISVSLILSAVVGFVRSTVVRNVCSFFPFVRILREINWCRGRRTWSMNRSWLLPIRVSRISWLVDTVNDAIPVAVGVNIACNNLPVRSYNARWRKRLTEELISELGSRASDFCSPEKNLWTKLISLRLTNFQTYN